MKLVQVTDDRFPCVGSGIAWCVEELGILGERGGVSFDVAAVQALHLHRVKLLNLGVQVGRADHISGHRISMPPVRSRAIVPGAARLIL